MWSDKTWRYDGQLVLCANWSEFLFKVIAGNCEQGPPTLVPTPERRKLRSTRISAEVRGVFRASHWTSQVGGRVWRAGNLKIPVNFLPPKCLNAVMKSKPFMPGMPGVIGHGYFFTHGSQPACVWVWEIKNQAPLWKQDFWQDYFDINCILRPTHYQYAHWNCTFGQ